MKRRDFLKATTWGTIGLTALASSRGAWARTLVHREELVVASRNLDIAGKSAKVFGLMRPDGSHGLTTKVGEVFSVNLSNRLDEPTLIHWHGLTPPWDQDGVPDNPMPMIQPGLDRRYYFPLESGGTHWMHAHTLQEQNLLAAPLIVRTQEDEDRDEQEVVILLHDFSFTPAEELLATLKGSGQESSGQNGGHGHMSHGAMPKAKMDHSSAGHSAMAMDLNDIEYDAYLANDRTLSDPQVIRVERGGKIRLRIINGATATAFIVDLGSLEGELIAVDGHEIEPIKGKRFPMTMAQRLDIRLSLPNREEAFPILALREGAPQRTGVILAPQRADIRRLPITEGQNSPLVTLDLEKRLRAKTPLSARSSDKRLSVVLDGTMTGYDWRIEGGDALKVAKGDRVEIAIRNKSMMAHPMHLHGHSFQVVALDDVPLQGAVRDTILVMPGGTATIAFDAVNPGRWPFHCHHLYHMVSGMMAFVAYEGFET